MVDLRITGFNPIAKSVAGNAGIVVDFLDFVAVVVESGDVGGFGVGGVVDGIRLDGGDKIVGGDNLIVKRKASWPDSVWLIWK